MALGYGARALAKYSVSTGNSAADAFSSIAIGTDVRSRIPGVKSAADIKKEGGSINVGESYTRLLEKIEELTLYTIAQQKEIDALKKIMKRKSVRR